MQVATKGYDRQSKAAICIRMYNKQGLPVFNVVKLLNNRYAIKHEKGKMIKNNISWAEAQEFARKFKGNVLFGK